jgi:hypothetical protein
MTARTVILVGPRQRQTAHTYIDEAPDGFVMRLQEPTKKRTQELKYHAMIDDIAKQTTYAGKSWDADDMKRILIDEFAYEMRMANTPLHHDGRLIPSEDGLRIIQLGIQSRDFYVLEAAQFIQFLEAWGADRSVRWNEPGRYVPMEAA